MKTNVYFKETQRFIREWMWILFLLLGFDCLFGYGVIKQVIFGIPWGTKPASDIALITLFGFGLLMTLLFVCLRLETRITEEGIYVKYFPIHLAYRRYSWTDISKLYVKSYYPLSNGGWGISKNSYTVSGAMGLQLEFVSGKRLLIGTRKSKELTEKLNLIEKLKK